MSINVKIVELPDENCLEVLVASVAYFKGYKGEVTFAEKWSFNFLPENPDCPGIFADRPVTDIGNSINFLDQYHGIVLKKHDGNADMLLNCIKEEIRKENPIILMLDSYWCYWMPDYYQKVHVKTFSLAVGYNDSNQSIKCTHGFPIIYDINLAYEEFINACSSYITCDVIEKFITNESFLEFTNNCISSLTQIKGYQNSFHAMKDYGEQVGEKLNFELEKSKKVIDDVWAVSIIFYSYGARKSLMKFSKTLNFFKKRLQLDSLNVLIDFVEQHALQWNQICGLFVKLYYMPNDNTLKSRIANKIKEASTFGENILFELIKIKEEHKYLLRDKEYCADIEPKKQSSDEIICLDIQCHCNNKAFAHSISIDHTADIEETIGKEKYYYLADEHFNNQIQFLMGMKFMIPNTKSISQKDNILCNSQEIDIPLNFYSDIMVLGFSHLNDHGGYLKLVYESDDIEELGLKLTDFLSEEPHYQETIFWSGKGICRTSNEIKLLEKKFNVYANTYAINNSKKLKRIILPDNQFIHLLSISLKK